MSKEHRIDYHAGIIAALKTKYDDQYDFMETLKEHVLGEKPPRLDAVVLKKGQGRYLSDEIGCFFLGHNVFEAKGYGDGININDVYKVEAYALFYMTIDRKVDEIPLEEVTITILQFRFPRDVLKELEAKGCTVRKRTEGIYEVSGGPIIFPFQIVDAVILGEEWDVLKVLVPGATEEQVLKIQLEYEKTCNPVKKDHLQDVLRTSFESNPGVYRSLKEAGKMSDAFKMVFAEEIKEIEDRIAKKDEEITKKDEEIAKKDEEIAKKDEEIAKRDEGTIIQMLKDNVPASTICKWLSLPMEMIAYIAGKHGLKYRTIGK